MISLLKTCFHRNINNAKGFKVELKIELSKITTNDATKIWIDWAVVVTQLVERSLLIPEVRGLIPEVRGSNTVIGKTLFILNICLLSTVF